MTFRLFGAMVQKTACRLFGAKPVSKPMLGYCQLDALQWKLNQNSKISIDENAPEYVVGNMAAILSPRQWVKYFLLDVLVRLYYV